MLLSLLGHSSDEIKKKNKTAAASVSLSVQISKNLSFSPGVIVRFN